MALQLGALRDALIEAGAALDKANTPPKRPFWQTAGIVIASVAVVALVVLGSLFVPDGPPEIPTYSNGSSTSGYAQTTVASSSCGPRDVTVSHLRWRHPRYDSNTLIVTGVVSHDCSVAIGIELRITGYYENGDVAFSDSMWPTPANFNLPPGKGYPFEAWEDAPESENLNRVEATPIETLTW